MNNTKPKSKQKCPLKPNTLFSILLATLKTRQNQSLLKPTLTKLLHFLHPSTPPTTLHPHITPTIALLPTLLHSTHEGVVGTAAKIVGAVSLVSMEVSERVAGDEGVLRGLVLGVVRCKELGVRKCLVNGLLDVCVTSFGRKRLVQVSALDYVMLGFLQVVNTWSSSTSVSILEKDGDLCLATEVDRDEVPLLFLSAAVSLINVCDNEQLKQIPRKLIKALSPYLKEIWSNVRDQLLASKVLNYSKGKGYYISSITAYNLAESLFRLSMYPPGRPCSLQSDVVNAHIFGPRLPSYKNFILENWESSHFVMSKQPKDLDVFCNVFSSFMHLLTTEETVSVFLSTLLRGMTSCPPLALNEIDNLSFLDEVRETLGCPVIYQQDIRVVKTNLHSRSERHYFQGCLGNDIETPRSFSLDDILNCEVAYREGYTVAVRGMEYRLNSIAAIAREIASLFGQPSVGANLYVTPPGSQGLACHYDDHCVFVCQLLGTKQWTIYPQPIVQLPRLYEHIEVPQKLLVESRQILLREGDILYIPRGFAHEAQTLTDIDESSNGSEFSVHLTLAVEVEPPFEWEGFAHVAVHRWSHGLESDHSASCSSAILQAVSVNILHVAVMLLGCSERLFRKACLVAASSLPPQTDDWLEENQRTIFYLVISKICELASFTDSLKFLETAIQRNDDPFDRLRWLEHLNTRKGFVRNDCSFTLAEFCNILPFIYQNKDNAESAFASVKSKFCSEILFDDAKESFQFLHAMYKDARMQYMNGMLSLHY